MNPAKFEALSKQDFSFVKIAEGRFQTPSMGYTFQF